MSEDIGYAVTVTLPDGYFGFELYVAAPGDSVEPDRWARRFAARKLGLLAHYVPEAKLEITAVRRVS